MDRIGRPGFLALALLAPLGCADKRSEMISTGTRAENVDTLDAESTELLSDVKRDVTLSFSLGDTKKTLKVSALLERFDARELVVSDPNFKTEKRFVGIPLLPVLELGFGKSAESLRDARLVFEALDGYASPVDGEIVTRSGGFLAFDDLDVPGWAAIGEKRADPAPLYVVWTGEARDPKVYPWPWALRTVRIASEDEYAAASPGEDASELARRGHTLFLGGCVRCHAMNRAGGRLGPELNVPKNIVEYRPEAQIRAYIRNPMQFRYGNMPANPHLSDADLDALIAYFRVMKDRKQDPRGM
ncbi:MAG: cytochrome c [Myxococcota bacterium]